MFDIDIFDTLNYKQRSFVYKVVGFIVERHKKPAFRDHLIFQQLDPKQMGFVEKLVDDMLIDPVYATKTKWFMDATKAVQRGEM